MESQGQQAIVAPFPIPGKSIAYMRMYRAKYPERIATIKAKSAQRHRATENLRLRRWKAQNQDKVNASTALRRARQLQACPDWVDTKELAVFYRRARELTVETGIQHSVDHIIPLVNKIVCGLHVPANLQILTMQDNCRKYNQMEFQNG